MKNCIGNIIPKVLRHELHILDQLFDWGLFKYYNSNYLIEIVHVLGPDLGVTYFFLANGIGSGRSPDSAAGLSRKFYYSLSRMTKC